MLALAPPHHLQYADSGYSTPSVSRPSISRKPSSPTMPYVSSKPSNSRHSSSSSHLQRNADPSSSRTHTTAPPPAPTVATPPETTSESPKSPIDIHNYPAPQLLRLLASLLSQIAAANDSLSSPPHTTPSTPTHPHPPIWSTLTFASRQALSTSASSLTFHARNIPTISLHAYLLRILKYCPASNDVFLALLVYFDRMNRLSEEATGRAFVIDSYNVHRLVIAGVTVASKFFSDVFYTNSRYAKVGGLPQAELNQLELQFLLLNDFRLVIHRDEMQHYAEQLMTFSQSNPPPSDDTQPSPSIPAYVPQSQTSYNTVSSFSAGHTAGPSTPTLHQHQQAVMGAIDAYGGRVPGEEALQPQRPQPEQSHHTPKLRQQSSSESGYDTDMTETETETETEGGETDDEPTIRPTKSMDSLASRYTNDEGMGSP